MAGVYTIGSKLGYDMANGLGVGQSVTATDGSVWTKQPDGSISVYHQGQTMQGQITYQPTTAQQQNIASMAGSGGYTSPYADRLNQLLQQQASAQQGAASMSGSDGYKSPYEDRLNNVITGLENSKWEGWDPNTDPSMQAYRKEYLREADRTAENVLGQYAQNTGGIAGSQAIAAATQASDYYKSKLSDKIPELYENAYSRYLNEVAQKHNLANLMMNAEDQAHSQYYQRIQYAMNKWAQMGYADQEVASILGVTAGTPTSDQSYNDWNMIFQMENQANDQYYQRIQYAMNKWAQMGYADQEVASILGVTAGTPTSDQSYTDWTTAFEQEQYNLSRQQAAGSTPTGGTNPAPQPSDDSQNPVPGNQGMSEAEFNSFMRGLREYIAAGQYERFRKLLQENEHRLSDEQIAEIESVASRWG